MSDVLVQQESEREDFFVALHEMMAAKDGSLSVDYVLAGGNVARFRFDDLEYVKSRDLEAMLTVTLEMVGTTPQPFTGRINVLSLSSREAFTRMLGQSFGKEIKWGLILSKVCSDVRKLFSEKDRCIWLEDAGAMSSNPYLLAPFVVDKAANVLFGYGGVGKSYLTLRMAMTLASGVPFLGSFKPFRKVNTLYLDYEATEEEQKRRMFQLAAAPGAGFDIADVYRHISYINSGGTPLMELVPLLRKKIAEFDIGFLLVDSALSASGGEPEKADVVRQYFSAIQKLGVTSLTIAHVVKEEGKDTKPFGSAFWEYLPRNCWSAHLDERPEDPGTKHVRLAHRKCNVDQKHPDIGYNLSFAQDRSHVSLEREMPRKVREEEDASAQEAIYSCLKGRSMSTDDLVRKTGYAKKTVQNKTSIMKMEGKIGQVGDVWVRLDEILNDEK